MGKYAKILNSLYADYDANICLSDIQKHYPSREGQKLFNMFFTKYNLPDNCLPESELEKAQNAKILEEVTAELDAVNLKIIDAEALVKKAETDLTTSQQRGTHNSCWGGSSPELLGYCVARYKRILQARVRIKDKYSDLKTMLEERLRILQEEDARLESEEELMSDAEEIKLQMAEEEAAQTISEDIEIEVEVDLTGGVEDDIETGYEPTL